MAALTTTQTHAEQSADVIAEVLASESPANLADFMSFMTRAQQERLEERIKAYRSK